MKKRKYRGSDFRDFLAEEGILEEVEAGALKKALAYQLEKARKDSAITKTQMAKQMKTSRAAVDRLLDAKNPSATLNTLAKAASVLRLRLRLEVEPA